ncbi:ArsR/SmtB family transcription factor [Actinoplanes sp. NPDC051494]|uniref:ArsR/SmtB family transcription factor n=1 Tax=Actinoplanes sp. NPDC051494 TaxID=3363907 RepID=UPI00378A01CA
MIPRAVTVLQAMAYEHRLHILVLLRAGESTPDNLARRLQVDTTVVGHHLRYLRDAALVSRRRAGRNVHYRLRTPAVDRLIAEVLHYAEG